MACLIKQLVISYTSEHIQVLTKKLHYIELGSYVSIRIRKCSGKKGCAMKEYFVLLGK